MGPPPKLIADIGCGTGKATKYFAEKGYRVVALDLSRGMLDELIKQCSLNHTMPVLGNMKILPFADQSLDAIWCMASFVHLPAQEREITLEEFYRVLQPKGFLYLSVQNRFSKKHILRIIESYFYNIGYDENNNFYKRLKTPKEIFSSPSLLSRLIQGYAYLDQRHWFYPTRSELTRNLNKAGFRIINSNSLFSQRIYFLATKQHV